MNETLRETILNFLSVFLKIFSAKIDTYQWVNNRIKGFLTWKNEDGKQEFSWALPTESLDFASMIEILMLMSKRELIIGDKISVTKNEVLSMVGLQGWDESKTRRVIDQLCSIRVAMVDNGVETDYFVIHF